MNAHADLNKNGPVHEPADFTWAEISYDARFGATRGRITHSADDQATPTFLTKGSSPTDLAEAPALREWLMSGGFEEVALPAFRKARFQDYRALAMAIFAVLPEVNLIWPTLPQDDALERAAALWGAQTAARPAPIFAPEGPKADGANEANMTREIEASLRLLQHPESTRRIEAKLRHLRKTAAEPAATAFEEDAQASFEAESLKRGGLAANALIPASTPPHQMGLHVGSGYVLRPLLSGSADEPESITCERLGYSLSRTGHVEMSVFEARRQATSVAELEPRPGKVLKHEIVHALYTAKDRKMRVALGGLRVVGHGRRHIYMVSETGDALEPGAFCFNDGWQFVGMVVRTFGSGAIEGTGKPVVAVLRTSAVWDDLVARADLGCGRSANALSELARRLTRYGSRRPVPPPAPDKVPAYGGR
ncbi:MAG: hypothetical protein AAGF13_00720 [Pseudomonadota bacterium]